MWILLTLTNVDKAGGRGIIIFSSPQCQQNQAYCRGGESLLTWCAGLWARAQACHWNHKKVNYLEQRFWSIELSSSRQRAFDEMNTKCKQGSLSAAGQLYVSKPLLQVVYSFFTVLVTSSGASLLYNNNTDRTGD